MRARAEYRLASVCVNTRCPLELRCCSCPVALRQNAARATLQQLLSAWRNVFGLGQQAKQGRRELLPEHGDGQRLRLALIKQQGHGGWQNSS